MLQVNGGGLALNVHFDSILVGGLQCCWARLRVRFVVKICLWHSKSVNVCPKEQNAQKVVAFYDKGLVQGNNVINCK